MQRRGRIAAKRIALPGHAERQRPSSQANVAVPLCLIPSGDGRRNAASLGRSQANVAVPLCLIPSGDGRRNAASLGQSG